MQKIGVTILVVSSLVACFNRTSFYHFHAIDLDGWDRIDFQEYEVKALEEDAS